jgi:hypothetical protein
MRILEFVVVILIVIAIAVTGVLALLKGENQNGISKTETSQREGSKGSVVVERRYTELSPE